MKRRSIALATACRSFVLFWKMPRDVFIARYQLPICGLTKNWLLLMPYLSASSFACAGGKPHRSASPRSHIRRCVAGSGPTIQRIWSRLAANPSDLNGSWLFFQYGFRTARAEFFAFHSLR